MAKAIALKKHQINKVLEKIKLMQDKETKAAAIVLSHAGLRVTEIALLEVKHLIHPSGQIRSEVFLPAKICKGLKARTVWLSNPKAQRAIQDMIDYRLKKGWGTSLDNSDYQGLIPESRFLFNNRGRPYALADKKRVLVGGETKHYRACDALQNMIQKVYNRCGHSKASSHTGRKSLASNAVLRGVPLRDIANILGHSDEEITLDYIDFDKKELKRAYEVAL